MNFLQANIVFPITSAPVENGIVAIDHSGVIVDVIDPKRVNELPHDIKKVEGFLCPGFVNMHCHLELSHLKGKFEEKTGLVGFIDQMRTNRGGEKILEARIPRTEDINLSRGDICQLCLPADKIFIMLG